MIPYPIVDTTPYLWIARLESLVFLKESLVMIPSDNDFLLVTEKLVNVFLPVFSCESLTEFSTHSAST